MNFLFIWLVSFVLLVESQICGQDTNLAYGKRCGSSSILPYFIPESAVDGYLTTFQHTRNEQRPYWWVDLGQTYTINRVDIYNRQDGYGYRLHNLEVTVGKNLRYMMMLCGRFRGPGFSGQHIALKCPGKMQGRYVKLTLTHGNYNILHVAEVKVFGH